MNDLITVPHQDASAPLHGGVKMSEDDEISAMSQISAALAPLDDAARVRVLHWAASRFGATSSSRLLEGVKSPGNDKRQQADPQRYESFAELFEAARPSTEREKALVAAYWEQVCQEQVSFGSQRLNDSLKDLGHGIGNITDALSALKDERPGLALQLKKSGTSKQARKIYKLTQEGVRRVQEMISLEINANAA